MAASAVVGGLGALALSWGAIYKRGLKDGGEDGFEQGRLFGFKRGAEHVAREMTTIHERELVAIERVLIVSRDPATSKFGATLRKYHWAHGCDPGCKIDHSKEPTP
jgi:hypothetical protein